MKPVKVGLLGLGTVGGGTFNVLRRNADGFIEYDEDIKSIGADARLVLGEEIRHSILSLTVIEESEQDP